MAKLDSDLDLPRPCPQARAELRVSILEDAEPEEDESAFVQLTGVRLVQAAQLVPG